MNISEYRCSNWEKILLPGGLEVEMLRDQESHPGSGEEDPDHHDEGVDGADTPPEDQVTTLTTHLASARPLSTGSDLGTCSHPASF